MDVFISELVELGDRELVKDRGRGARRRPDGRRGALGAPADLTPSRPRSTSSTTPCPQPGAAPSPRVQARLGLDEALLARSAAIENLRTAAAIVLQAHARALLTRAVLARRRARHHAARRSCRDTHPSARARAPVRARPRAPPPRAGRQQQQAAARLARACWRSTLARAAAALRAPPRRLRERARTRRDVAGAWRARGATGGRTRRLFARFDADGSGTIDVDRLDEACVRVGTHPMWTRRLLLAEFAGGLEEELDFTSSPRCCASSARRVFGEADADGSGGLDERELAAALIALGHADADARALLELFGEKPLRAGGGARSRAARSRRRSRTSTR